MTTTLQCIPKMLKKLPHGGIRTRDLLFCRRGAKELQMSPLSDGRVEKMAADFFYRHGFRSVPTRVARWYIFKPKIPIWGNFGGPWNIQCWYILWPFGKFYNHLVYFMAIWYILWEFGQFSTVLVCCTKKNLATLVLTTLFFLRIPFLTNSFFPLAYLPIEAILQTFYSKRKKKLNFFFNFLDV
jgi:hypothetical protein